MGSCEAAACWCAASFFFAPFDVDVFFTEDLETFRWSLIDALALGAMLNQNMREWWAVESKEFFQRYAIKKIKRVYKSFRVHM